MATTPYPFVSGTVLTASQLNSTFNIPTTTKTASHTLIAADAGTRVIMNSASATTLTVNTSIVAASDVVEIQNIGAGVCTITAGTATVSTTGSLALAQNGSGRLVFTAAGTSIFQANGVAASASGLTLISTTTIGTTVSSVTVSSAFSSTYDNYKIIVSGGTASTFESLLLILGSTTTGYYAGIIGCIYSSGAVDSGSRNNAASWIIGNFNTNGIGANFELSAPNLAKNTFIGGFRVGNSTTSQGGIFAGFLNDTTQYTAFTISTGSGTLTGGTIKVYGYANS